MNLDHDFDQMSKLSEDQKKSLSKMEHFYFPNSSGHLRRMHTRVKLLGKIQPRGDIFHPHRVSAPLALVFFDCFMAKKQKPVGFTGLCSLRKIHVSLFDLKFFEILFFDIVNYFKHSIPGGLTSRPSFAYINSEHSCPILCRC